MSEDHIAVIMSRNPVELNPCDAVIPVQALYCEIEIKQTGGEIELISCGSAMVRYDELPALGYSFKTLADHFATRPNKFPNWEKPDKHPNRTPFRSSMSLGVGKKAKAGEVDNDTDKTPADTLVVIRLSDNLNWQFSRDGAPFSAGKVEAPRNQPICGWERHDGADVAGYGREDCFTASFKVVAGYIDRPSTGGRLDAPFNIHVEFLSKKDDTFIPVILDPDVGYPGGTGGRP